MIKTKSGLLVSAFIFFVIAYFLSTPVQSLFIKFFIPFPKLAEATLYEGKMEVVGKSKCRGRVCSAPKYYVTTKDGNKHEIFYWLVTDKFNRYDKEYANDATGKFWFHPIFGVIQEEITFHRNGLNSGVLDGKTSKHSYLERKSLYENYFEPTKYYFQSMGFLAFFVIGLVNIFKAYKKTN